MSSEIQGLQKSFGGLAATRNVDFYINEGEIVGPIGPNGAGKATLFNVRQLFDFIRSLRDEGITILIVEQNVQHALEVADRAYMLENGHIVLDGKSRELLANEHVKKAYFGI